MANTLSIVVDAVWKGAPAIQKAQADVGKLERDAKGGAAGIGSSFKSAAIGIGAVVGVLGAAALAGRQLYATLREGAQLQTIKQRFDKLSESIGTTADAMLGKLRTATKGMIDDMSLMSSASQIISLRLADNESQVTRLATVVGTLGWDMQQVIQTFANMSTMRLDALGLSVKEVENKAAELEKQGYSTAEAFKEAVILAGEARLDVGGVSEAEAAFKRFEASITDTKNALLENAVALANNIGLVSDLNEMATRSGLNRAIKEARDELEALGRLGPTERLNLGIAQTTMSVEELEVALETALNDIDNALLYNEGAWAAWGITVSQNSAIAGAAALMAAREVVAASTEMFRALTVGSQLDWMGGAMGAPTVLTSSVRDARGEIRNLKREMDVAFVRHDPDFLSAGTITRATMAYDEATTSVRSFGVAISAAEEAEAALAAAHGRLASAFSAEVMAKPEEGLIDAAGVVNMENANKALYEQAQAAGATAAQLAMLGVATGQFTEEQAQAALKAAILQERIKQIAAGVASGELSYSDAAGGLASFGEALNAGALGDVAGGIEGVAQAATDFASGTYEAELSVEDAAARTAILDIIELIGQASGTFYTNFVVTTTNDGTPSTDAPGRIGVERNAYTVDTRQSGFAGGGGGTRMLEWQGDGGGSGATDSRTAYNVTVNNYIDGQKTSNRQLEDITTDKLRAALNSLGVRR
jgi:hypothetical protein